MTVTITDTGELLADLNAARDRLDRSTALMQQGLDLLDLLDWGILDMDYARAEVDAFKRARLVHKRGAP